MMLQDIGGGVMRYLITGLGVALALSAGAGAEWEVETVAGDGTRPEGESEVISYQSEAAEEISMHIWGSDGPYRFKKPPYMYAEYPDWKYTMLYDTEEKRTKINIEDATSVEVIGAVSIFKHFIWAGFEGDQYETWLKLRADGEEGWWGGQYLGARPPVAIAVFREPYGPLREGPGEEYPAVAEETSSYEPKSEWLLKPYVSAGTLYELVVSFGDWYCVGDYQGGGWVPKDAPGLETYGLVSHWLPPRDIQVIFAVYLPTEGEVNEIRYSGRGFLREAEFPFEDPVMTVNTAHGTFEIIPEDVGGHGTYESRTTYFVAALARPVDRDDLSSISLAVGIPPYRFEATVDPRPAWAEYDAQK
jgi:hypothetical protein